MAIDKLGHIKNLHQAIVEYSEITKGISLNTNDYNRLKNIEGFDKFFIVENDLNGVEYWNGKIVTHSELVPSNKFYLI